MRLKAEKNPEVKAKLEELQASWGIEPANLHKILHEKGVAYTQEFLREHSQLVKQLFELKLLVGSDKMPVIYTGEDEIVSVVQPPSEGENTGNDDYLESFERFIKEQVKFHITRILCHIAMFFITQTSYSEFNGLIANVQRILNTSF